MMKLLHEFSQVSSMESGCVVTIGNFDGVHIGHRAILKRVCQEKERMELPALIFLFEPQPNEFLYKGQSPPRLYGLREKVTIFKQFGIDYVFCLKFDKKMLCMSPNDFFQNVLARVHPRFLIVGNDFRFGQDRAGDGSLLAEMGRSLGCCVHLFEQFKHEDIRVSSTKIRELLKKGDLLLANQLLGCSYFMMGRVIPGQGLGRTVGIPTANLRIFRQNPPISGVFFVQVTCQNKEIKYGVANIGRRPTVGGNHVVLEVHLFEFDRVLYGEHLVVSFLYKLRDEKKFSSFDELVAQIKTDIELAKELARAHVCQV